MKDSDFEVKVYPDMELQEVVRCLKALEHRTNLLSREIEFIFRMEERTVDDIEKINCVLSYLKDKLE